MKKTQIIGIFLAISLAIPSMCFAGMPSLLPEDVASILRLNDEPQQRLQVISFFLAGLVLSTVFIRFCWNSLAKDFSRLPRLGFGRAFVIVVMWGMLFVIVLTMISGARELMTPGAWHKQGITYTLDKPQVDPADTHHYQVEGNLNDALHSSRPHVTNEKLAQSIGDAHYD